MAYPQKWSKVAREFLGMVDPWESHSIFRSCLGSTVALCTFGVIYCWMTNHTVVMINSTRSGSLGFPRIVLWRSPFLEMAPLVFAVAVVWTKCRYPTTSMMAPPVTCKRPLMKKGKLYSPVLSTRYPEKNMDNHY